MASNDGGDAGPDQPEDEPRRVRTEKARLLRWLHPDGVDWGANVGDFHPASVDRSRGWMRHLFGEGRYFPVEVEGWDHIPSSPVMVVSNHSGGTLFLDAWGLLFAWYGHFGTERPLHPAAHEIILSNRLSGSFFAKRGVVRADRHVATRVLTRWKEDLLVMPGGDLDVWRPWTKRYEVRFAGRKGYARLALEAGIPVVPLANAGAQETFFVLTDGRRIAEALRMPQIARAHIWPIHLSLPWGLAIGPWPHLPIPARLRYRFGPAVHASDFLTDGSDEVTDQQVDAFDAAVQAGVQSQLDRLRDER
ncbi:MAG: 1-acyl-sn-glycerol-3-phosphate acyltransferase [Sandaracinaceae bacterium]